MNERIRQLAEQCTSIPNHLNPPVFDQEKFAQLLLGNLAEELVDVARRSKQTNPEWANGLNHASVLAQRMTMNLPQWPDAE
jgi:hypothetical protein